MARALVGFSIAGVLAALLGTAAPALGQDTFTIEIVDRGQPVADVEVLFLVNRGKTERRTGGDGTLQVDMNLANMGKGDPVDVYVIECDDVVVVVFVGPGEQQALDEECERRRQENPNCTCRRIGVFAWGDHVRVDVGTRTVTSTPSTTAIQPTRLPGAKDLFTFGFTGGVSYWPKFEDTAGSATGATATDATTWSPTVGAYAEWGFPRTGLRVGIAGQYSWGLETRTTFGDQAQAGDIDYYGLGGYGRYEFGEDMSRTTPYLSLGGFHAWNKGDFTMEGEDEHRVHKTWRGNVGAGLVHWVTPKVGVWGEALYSWPIGDNDADQNVRGQLGVAIRPLWGDGVCGGSCLR